MLCACAQAVVRWVAVRRTGELDRGGVDASRVGGDARATRVASGLGRGRQED